MRRQAFRTHLAGTVSTPGGPPVGVRSWSDGRAWLTVRATGAWPGGRLFGDLGLDVRPLDLGTAGVGYASSDGRRIGLHAGRTVPIDAGGRLTGRIGRYSLGMLDIQADDDVATPVIGDLDGVDLDAAAGHRDHRCRQLAGARAAAIADAER